MNFLDGIWLKSNVLQSLRHLTSKTFCIYLKFWPWIEWSMFSNKTFVQKYGLFDMDPLYLTLKITAMLRNKYLQLKTWIMGSKNVYMRDRFSGRVDNSQAVGRGGGGGGANGIGGRVDDSQAGGGGGEGGEGKLNRGNGLRSLLPTIRISLNYFKSFLNRKSSRVDVFFFVFESMLWGSQATDIKKIFTRNFKTRD